MEYLVTMTTHVPEGTPDKAVTDVRAREAAHTRELAEQGHILRLWRPPLLPGEWRTDEVTPLAPHPNDPGLPARPGATEFLTTFAISVAEGTPGQVVADTEAAEAQRAKELAARGHLLRLWRLPGEGRALGLWRARDATEMQAILKSLPMDRWMRVETTPLTPHPSQPGAGPVPGHGPGPHLLLSTRLSGATDTISADEVACAAVPASPLRD